MTAITGHFSSASDACSYVSSVFRISRMSANKNRPRIAAAAAFVTVCGLLYLLSLSHTTTAQSEIRKYPHNRIVKDPTGFAKLYDAIRHPVAADLYVDVDGNVFETKDDGPYWTKPLKNNVLVVDIDTRVPQGPNELWNDGPMNWETLKNEGGGTISAGHMNHFLYGEYYKSTGFTPLRFNV
jgi:hypothetical protein